MTKEEENILDLHYPPCGKCWLCGHKDKRHRLWDVFIDSKEPSNFLAHIHETTIKHIEDVRRIRPYRNKKRSV